MSRGPVRRVHIAQSYYASEKRVIHHLPDEAEELLKKRFQIIKVSHDPFAFSSLGDTGQLRIDRLGLDRGEESDG